MYDPVKKYKTKLFKENILSFEEAGKIEQEIQKEIGEAIKFAIESEEPLAETVGKFVYQEEVNG